MFKKIFFCLFAAMVAIGSADAAVVKYTYDFYAGFDPETPFNTVAGSVSIIFDPLLIPQAPTLVDSINLTIGSKTYLSNEAYYQQFGGGLIFGSLAPINSITSNTNDFMLSLNGLKPSSGGSLTYAVAGFPLLYRTSGVAFQLHVSAVPLPSTFWLFSAGLFAIANVYRNRRQA